MKSTHINDRLVVEDRGKSEYPEKKTSEQSREPTNLIPLRWRVCESNQSHIGERRALSPRALCHLCFCYNFYLYKLLFISDIVEKIMEHMLNPSKTRRQVINQLVNMGIVEDRKMLRKKRKKGERKRKKSNDDGFVVVSQNLELRPP